MKIIFIIIILLLKVLLAELQQDNQVRNQTSANITKNKNEQNFQYQDLPLQWIWSNIGGINFLTAVRNQNLPQYCNSGWAFAATSVLSDRIKIQSFSQSSDIHISPQVLLSCNQENQGCQGGSSLKSFAWIILNNITDETCSHYQAKGWNNGVECNADIKCRRCYVYKTCWSNPRAKIYSIQSYGEIFGEKEMMLEIYKNGPIACGIALTKEFYEYNQGIFQDLTNNTNIVHEVAVSGWGENDDGQKYWFVRNSFGAQWGENGFFKIVRGENNLGIETICSWAIPSDTWTTDIRNSTATYKLYSNYFKQFEQNILELTSFAQNQELKQCKIKNKGNKINLFVNSKESIYELAQLNLTKTFLNFLIEQRKFSDTFFPETWDWRNVNGFNFLTPVQNQYLNENWCGTCYIFAAVQSLQDRINIMRANSFPQILLSIQDPLNCAQSFGCQGGSSLAVYKYIKQHGIQQDTCSPYKNLKLNCTKFNTCSFCDMDQQCFEVNNYQKWTIQDYGKVQGSIQMKLQIYKYGPISCSIQTNQVLNFYQRGIISQKLNQDLPLNHAVSVVGWGVFKKIEYWIARNQEGTFWGESGYFRIRIDKNNLGIEKSCAWAIPKQ